MTNPADGVFVLPKVMESSRQPPWWRPEMRRAKELEGEDGQRTRCAVPTRRSKTRAFKRKLLVSAYLSKENQKNPRGPVYERNWQPCPHPRMTGREPCWICSWHFQYVGRIPRQRGNRENCPDPANPGSACNKGPRCDRFMHAKQF